MENTPNTITEHITMDTPEQFIGIFGIREENMPLFREELGVEIYAHGDDVTITGEPEKVAPAWPLRARRTASARSCGT